MGAGCVIAPASAKQPKTQIMLATIKQIAYLQHLTDRAESIKMRHPSLIPQGLMHTHWDIDMTSDKASARIDYYNAILSACDTILFPHMKVAESRGVCNKPTPYHDEIVKAMYDNMDKIESIRLAS